MPGTGITEMENVWIEMRDGCHLAAKVWLPEDAGENPVPAVLEYIPYRKRDFKAIRDTEIHRFFAAHGYASVRVDLRGSGDSEGVLRDEYLPAELEDGLEVLRWIAGQEWCSGKVGIIGLSWGGFNGLQLASLRPEELGAVITVCSSDDRYGDDIHYMGGCLLTDNLSWASTMFSYNSLPPDPEVVGDRWMDMWMERLEGSGLWLSDWLKHQRRDDYWRHASVSENYGAIECPVFAVSGWADGYSNTVFRLMENLDVPRKGLIGAWGHKYPHMGGPGPAIDFLGECVRWWDRWLKGVQNGVEKDPLLRVWMQDTISPTSDRRPGRWVAETEWPSPRVERSGYQLRPGVIDFDSTEFPSWDMSIRSPLSVGLFAGKWCSYSEDTDLPSDQREEDGGALVFDSPPLEKDMEILGAPTVALALTSDRPQAMVAVRLSDVSPEGRATRVTYGLLNLCHMEDHSAPGELVPGEEYQIEVPLNFVAQRFPRDHRIRLAISTSYWPLAWPSPRPPLLTVVPERSSITLPVRPPREEDRDLRDLGSPRAGETLERSLLAPALREWKVIHNLATNEVVQRIVNNDARYRLDGIDLTLGNDNSETYSYINNQYDTVRGEVLTHRLIQRGDWKVETFTRTVLTSDPERFRIRATLDAYLGDSRVKSKSWDEEVPRDMI
ncbi:MAG: CocE/NonD family hydrolase [Methanomassiliicoccales archaeon]